MNTQRFSEALNEIDSKYISEALQYHGKQKTRRWGRWGAVAASFAVICTVLFAALPRFRDSISQPPQGDPPASAAEYPESLPPASSQAPPAIRLHMGELFVNEIGGFADRELAEYDPAQYDTAYWDGDELAAYYGKDLSPAYIPQGLKAAPGNGKAQIIMQKDGTIVFDIVNMAFYHDYYEDGSPKLTDDVPAVKGVSITASKTGLIDGCDYLMPENGVKTSLIGKTAVTFGYVSMEHGPYDGQTHEPSGSYGLYTAEFEYGGIEYQIITEQLKMEEIVKVAASIIFEGNEVVVEREPW